MRLPGIFVDRCQVTDERELAVLVHVADAASGQRHVLWSIIDVNHIHAEQLGVEQPVVVRHASDRVPGLAMLEVQLPADQK